MSDMLDVLRAIATRDDARSPGYEINEKNEETFRCIPLYSFVSFISSPGTVEPLGENERTTKAIDVAQAPSASQPIPRRPEEARASTEAASATSRPDLNRMEWDDIFEERAAIREFDGGFTRAEAERLAWIEIEMRRQHHKTPPPAEADSRCQEGGRQLWTRQFQGAGGGAPV